MEGGGCGLHMVRVMEGVGADISTERGDRE